VSNKLADLARRRESLILRSGGQRERLAEGCERLARSIQWAHIARGLIRKIKDNSGALMGITAFLGGRRIKFLRVSNWLALGWTLFQALRARRARRRA
jgi:hypothetical protein